MKKWSILLLIAGVFVGYFVGRQSLSRGPAAIPSRQVEIEVEKIVPVEFPKNMITQESVALAIPTDMAPTNDLNQVRNEIMDHNVQNFIQGKYLRNSELLKSAQKVQEAVQPKVTFGGSEGGIQHSVNLQIEAFQHTAKIQYEGFVKSDIEVEAETQDLSVRLSENIGETTELALEHETKKDLSFLRFNWNW